MRNQAYLKYCFSLALTFSTFILFQQNAYAIFTHVMHVHAQHYAMAYALASSPYLLSTIAVRKLIQKMTIGAIAKTGTGLLATGYLMLALAALFPAHLLSTFFGWLGVMIAMAGTGIAMPSSKIGAISSIETQIGTASSGMKFIQIGSSIGIAWIAAHMMDTGNATSTLVLLAVCASIAALIHYSSQLKIQDMPYSKKEASLA